MWLVQSDSFSQILSHAYVYVCVCVTFGLANVMNYILLCLYIFFPWIFCLFRKMWWISWCGFPVGMVRCLNRPSSSRSHSGLASRCSLSSSPEMSMSSAHTPPTLTMRTMDHTSGSPLETQRWGVLFISLSLSFFPLPTCTYVHVYTWHCMCALKDILMT